MASPYVKSEELILDSVAPTNKAGARIVFDLKSIDSILTKPHMLVVHCTHPASTTYVL